MYEDPESELLKFGLSFFSDCFRSFLWISQILWFFLIFWEFSFEPERFLVDDFIGETLLFSSFSDVREKLRVFFIEEFLKSEGLLEDFAPFSFDADNKSIFLSINRAALFSPVFFSLDFLVFLKRTLSSSLSAVKTMFSYENYKDFTRNPEFIRWYLAKNHDRLLSVSTIISGFFSDQISFFQGF